MGKKGDTLKDLNEAKVLLEKLKKLYMQRAPVIGVRLEVKGSEKETEGARYVFRVYLGRNPTPEEWQKLRNSFQGVSIYYSVIGNIMASNLE